MNGLKKMYVAIVLCAIALCQVDVCAKQVMSVSSMPTKALVDADVEETVNAEAVKVNATTQQAQAIIDGANETIRITQDKSRRGEISRAKAAVIVGEQEYLIKQARKQLTQVLAQAIQKVKEAEAQAGYSLGGLVSGIKSWYYGPQEIRSAAESALNELQKEFKDAQAEYAVKMQATDPQAAEQYSNEWNTIKQDFENEINKQKRIASGGMSTGFWTAVAGAAVVVGGAVAYKYLKSANQGEMRSTNAADQRWLDRAMKTQEQLENIAVEQSAPKGYLGRMQDRAKSGKEKLSQYSKASPESKKQYEDAKKSFGRANEAAIEERERLAEQRRKRHQPPVVEPVVITLESAREAYDHAKKRADAAEAKLTKAQKEFDDNAAEIARLSAAGARGKNAVKIRDLERRQAGRLSKALTNAETTFGSAENSLISASRKLADVSE